MTGQQIAVDGSWLSDSLALHQIELGGGGIFLDNMNVDGGFIVHV